MNQKVDASEFMYDEFTVEKILDRRHYKGQIQYLVKWLNYTDEENTWEMATDLECLSLINSFESVRNLKRGQNLNTLYEKKAKRLKIDPSLVIDNPFNHDLKAQEIREAFKISGEISFSVKFFDLEQPVIIPCGVAYVEIPQMVLKFYEKQWKFEDSQNEYLRNYI
ncbi:chromobox protein homolog 5 [Drosophila elegans]|uniref:chromobox protein homolog 5 n=1 Tax=Drosophila elegans TaxID=30023 RepID=UPI0007E78BD0|nr:chromobox protein homolog 5 [Drosophila elegans]